MLVHKKITRKITVLAERFEESFELRFERFARDPKVLAFAANSLNAASLLKIEIRKIEREFSSFRARLKQSRLL